jgi:putative endonuclease
VSPLGAGSAWARRRLGQSAERAACRHLKGRGLSVVARNYRALRGELDIICRDGEAWVFVEVKARSSDRYGGAEWAVPPAKRRQVAKVARHFLLTRGLYGEVPCRFDVVLVDAGARPLRVTHIENAFPSDPL